MQRRPALFDPHSLRAAALQLENLATDQQVEPLLMVANQWTPLARLSDRFADQLDRMKRAAAGLRDTEGRERLQALREMQAAADGMEALLSGLYPAFKAGRERLRQAAQFWGMRLVPRTHTSEIVVLAHDSEAELLAAVRSNLDRLAKAPKDLKGAEDVIEALREAAKRPPVSPAERKAVIDTGADFADTIHTLYARGTALLRRAFELAARASGAPGGSLWEPLWRDDPELAGRDA